MTSQRLKWAPIVQRAAKIVRSYATGVTLRQLFYRLVSEQWFPNTQNKYKALSEKTAKARRESDFPDLIDLGRKIHRPLWFASPDDGLGWLTDQYRRDRTEGQEVSLYLGIEKRGIVEQLSSWFSEMGLPILPLGGYASQTFVTEVADDVARRGRPGVLIYAGDFDASGEDIDRDFLDRTGCWDRVVRVALNSEQVEEFGLPVNAGKSGDSRAAGFKARHGELVQVEVDALRPDTLRGLFADAIADFWDESAYLECLARENADVSVLRLLTGRLGDIERGNDR